MYEPTVKRRWRGWEWSVCDHSRNEIASGRESSRPAARYQAARALFQLLLTNSRLCDLSGSAEMVSLKRKRRNT
jgi:hypothetical protein